MKSINQLFINLGLSGLVFGVCSLAALVFSFLSFIGYIPVTSDQLSSIVIGSLGLLMAAVVALTAKRRVEIMEIKNAVGVSESKILSSTKDVESGLAFGARQAKHFVLDTSLSRMIPDPTPIKFFSGIQNGYRRAVYDRVKNGEISFKRVEIIFHQQGLEWVIFRLLLHEGYDYRVRHYERPNRPIPMLSFVSFDGTIFYLGGFRLRGSSTEETSLFIQEHNLAQILSDYWDAFWRNATPLNEGGIINWQELRRIGVRVGITEEEFESMLNNVKKEVAKEKRKIDT